MNRVGKIFEIGYLVMSVVFAFEAYTRWTIEREKSYIFLILMILAIFMFFFRRKTRIRREEYFKNNK